MSLRLMSAVARCFADGVPQGDQLRVLQASHVEQRELLLHRFAERRYAGANGARPDQDVQLVDQAVCEQVVPRAQAAEADDVTAVAGPQLGNPGVRLAAADDLGARGPGAVSSGAMLSEMTTLAKVLWSREISRSTSGADASLASGGQ